jgi:hypothetical protein
MSVRLLAWLQGAGTGVCRLGERVGDAWRLSEPLAESEIADALQTIAAGGSPEFDGTAVVHGVAGATDITEYAAALTARLDARQQAREEAVGVRLLVWNSSDHRLAAPCESGGWKISAELEDRALWRAMRALAAGRRPKFKAIGVVAGFVGDVDDITGFAAQAIADNRM